MGTIINERARERVLLLLNAGRMYTESHDYQKCYTIVRYNQLISVRLCWHGHGFATALSLLH